MKAKDGARKDRANPRRHLLRRDFRRVHGVVNRRIWELADLIVELPEELLLPEEVPVQPSEGYRREIGQIDEESRRVPRRKGEHG